MSRRSKLSIILGTLAIAAVATAVVVGAVSSSASNVHPKVATSRATERRAFAVLRSTTAREAAVVSHPLPAGILEGMARFPGRAPPEAVYTGGTYATWIVPGSRETCLVVGSVGKNSVPSIDCGSLEEAVAGQITLTTETDDGSPLAFGIAPNSNSSVNVTEADGANRSVPVKNNVYEITTGTPASVQVTAETGEVTTDAIPPPSKP